MKILFVTDFYKPHIGGVEKLFSSLAEALVAKGDSVTFITWHYQRDLPVLETINGVRVIRISSPTRMLFSLIGIPVIIREARRADLIHTSTYSSAVGAWLGSKLTGKKIILTVHEVWGGLWMKMPFITAIEKWIFRLVEKGLFLLKFDRYIAVSDFTRTTLEEAGVPASKITRIYNGIDEQLPQWTDPGLPYTFCFFGRAGVSKGLDLLMDASEMLIDNRPDIRFKFIISPQIKKIYRQLYSRITNGKLNECSLILSGLPYSVLEKELLSSNCILIPSLCEGFGFTAVEASAMNIPLISSGMGSLPEVVSGKVITMETYSAESLYKAMEAAVDNRFDIIPGKRFSIDDFIANHKKLYIDNSGKR